MASPERLSNHEFFNQLTALFASATAKEKSSVFLTQKALLPFGAVPADTPVVDPYTTDAPLQLLIRATNGDSDKKTPGKKIKFSTIVEATELEGFFARYTEVAKGGMTALKKRDRKGRKLKARKKGKKEELPVVTA
ncbi:hypothetical protein Q9L58_001152 [Maublancomyces gigas]|uniref:Signal recognition particle subunit SRP14 n=1 Tax=Discina gigas TaxID=1032678 RepID=A0ABR3GW61_9PEZI